MNRYTLTFEVDVECETEDEAVEIAKRMLSTQSVEPVDIEVEDDE